MKTIIQFAGISGSLRKGSYNSALIRSTIELLPEGVNMNIIPIGDIPLYNADCDKPTLDQRPEEVRKLRTALAEADGLVIASPEYNFGIPGLLKNVIDWASRGKDSPLKNKPIALMGATPGMWGTVRMQTAFQNLYLYLNMKPVYQPEIFISKAKEKFDDQGNLIDEKARGLIQKKLRLLKEICEETRELKATT